MGDAGIREWASLAMLDAIDFAGELGITPPPERKPPWFGGDVDWPPAAAARSARVQRRGPGAMLQSLAQRWARLKDAVEARRAARGRSPAQS